MKGGFPEQPSLENNFNLQKNQMINMVQSVYDNHLKTTYIGAQQKKRLTTAQDVLVNHKMGRLNEVMKA